MGGFVTIPKRASACLALTLAVSLEGTWGIAQVSPAGAEQSQRLSYGLETDINFCPGPRSSISGTP